MAETFRFADLGAKTPLPGFVVSRHTGVASAVQEVRLAAGEGSDFAHAHETEQYILMLEGRMRIDVGEGSEARTLVLSAGDGLHLPPNTRHGSIWAEEDCRFIDFFNQTPPPL